MSEIALTPAQRRRSLLIAMSCTSAVGTTMGLTWPLLSLILDSRGVSSGLIGLSAASQSVAILAIAPIAPRVIGRAGVLRTSLACMVIATLMLILLPLHVDVVTWFPVRFLLGASVLLLFIAGETWINQIATDDIRGLVGGIFGFLWSGGFALGPLIISVTGIEGWSPFLCAIALVVAAALLLPLARDVAPVIEGRSKSSAWQLLRLAPAPILAALALGAVDAINDSLLSLFSLRSGFDQKGAVLVLAVFFAGTTLGHLPIGWLTDRVDRGALLIATTAATLALTVVLIFAMGSDWFGWAAVFLWGAALGGIWTVAFALIGDRFRGAELAAVTTLYGLLYGVGSAFGPIVAGHAMELWQPIAMPLVIAVLLFAYLCLCLRFRPTTP